jgi:hypothetical protein
LVRPVTLSGLDDPVLVTPPGLEVTVYEVIGLPPLEVGGLKVTVACLLPPVAVAPLGTPGSVGAGVTLLEGFEAGPVPTPLVAVTEKV